MQIDTKLRPLGVPLILDFSFFFLPAIFIIQMGLFNGLTCFGLVFISLLAHEYGHVWAAQKLGVYVDAVKAYFFGAAALLDPNMVMRPKKELLIAAAGPAVSLMLSFIGIGFAYSKNFYVIYFLLINLMLAIFNLLPLYPLDGGRIFKAFMAFKLPLFTSLKIAVRTSVALCLLMFGLSIYFGVFWLSLISVLVIFLAVSEELAFRRSEKSYINT